MKLNSLSHKIIIISAHIDHLGHDQWTHSSHASSDDRSKIHPGADDNASGVAALLETARQLSLLKSQGKLTGSKDIVLAGWTGEELGLLGSTYFLKQQIKNAPENHLHDLIDAVINLDMVGHVRGKLILQGVGSSQDWTDIINQLPKDKNLSIVAQSDPYLPTDSTSFYMQSIPTLNFFSGAHEHYHTPKDTANDLNYQGIVRVSELLLKLILILENRQQQITFHEVSQKQLAVRTNFKVYLGTIPDYSSSEELGVKLSGVIKGSPASKSGLKSGDIILQLADMKIQSIYDFSKALNLLTPGEKIDIVIFRHGQRMVLTIKTVARG